MGLRPALVGLHLLLVGQNQPMGAGGPLWWVLGGQRPPSFNLRNLLRQQYYPLHAPDRSVVPRAWDHPDPPWVLVGGSGLSPGMRAHLLCC